MTWYAVVAVDDAVDAARGFLFPVSPVAWTKLAVLAVFMSGAGVDVGTALPATLSVPPGDGLLAGGGGWGGVGLGSGIGTGTETGRPSIGGVAAGDPVPTVPVPGGRTGLAAAGAGVAVVALLAAGVAATLRLVFYDALRTGTVGLWRPFRRRAGQGMRLALFRIGVAVAAVAPVAAAVAVADRRGVTPAAVEPAVLAAAGVAAALLLVAGGLTLRFTGEFVAPVMTLTDGGVIAGWRRFWPALRANPVQYLLYLVVHAALALCVGVLESVVALLVGGVVLSVGALAVLAAAAALGGLPALVGSAAGLAALAAIGLAAGVALAAVLLPLWVLTTVYLTAHGLCTLGGTDPDLLLLPESVLPSPEVLD